MQTSNATSSDLQVQKGILVLISVVKMLLVPITSVNNLICKFEPSKTRHALRLLFRGQWAVVAIDEFGILLVLQKRVKGKFQHLVRKLRNLGHEES